MFLLYLETCFISPKSSLEQDRKNPEIENHKPFSIFTEVKNAKERGAGQKPKQKNPTKTSLHNSLPPQADKKGAQEWGSNRLNNKKVCYRFPPLREDNNLLSDP